jgi:hypothetical protein
VPDKRHQLHPPDTQETHRWRLQCYTLLLTSLSFIKAQPLAEIYKFTTKIEQLHKEVSTQVSRQRRKQREAHNARTHLVQPNFHPGDYVLRAIPKMRQHKLSLTWKGPYVVENVYAIHTLRLRSMIQDIMFVTQVTRARIY